MAGAAATATSTATSTATAIRGPGTSQYIRTSATTAAPTPAVITAAAADQYRPVNRTSSHVPANAVTAPRNACGAPGEPPGGIVAAVSAAVTIAAHAAPSVDDRDPPRPALPIATVADEAQRRGGEQDRHQQRAFVRPSAAATRACPPRRAHRR